MKVEFIDQTLRDGQQSLWGLRMRAHQALPALADLDATGYRTVDVTGAGMFTVLLRTFRDDPWATLDQLVAGLPRTPKRAGTRTVSVGGMGFAPDSVVDLWIRLLVRHGIDSLWLFDCSFDLPQMQRVAGVVTAAGAHPVPTLMYGLTSVHDDAFFASRAAQMARWPGVEAIEVEDAAGVLTPERARTLLPAVVQAAGGTPVELHCHCTTGMAPVVYVDALEAGIAVLHTCSRPMANGPSLPSVEGMLTNLEVLGHEHELDCTHLQPVADHFVATAHAAGGPAAGYPLGQPNEYQVAPYEIQLPGGMTGSLRSQLAQYGMLDRLPAVLAEIPQVRKDLGEPIMATPFSQFVGIQALLNVITGTRYSLIPDEVVQYALGQYGPLAQPVSSDVEDRILGSDRAKHFASWTRPQPSLAELRQSFGTSISEEELLLRVLHSGEEVDGMLAAGPSVRDPRLASSAIVANITDLLADTSPGVTSLAVTSPALTLSLRRASTPPAPSPVS